MTQTELDAAYLAVQTTEDLVATVCNSSNSQLVWLAAQTLDRRCGRGTARKYRDLSRHPYAID
jgi:hypothetical protein